jgi:hypothetical protein
MFRWHYGQSISVIVRAFLPSINADHMTNNLSTYFVTALLSRGNHVGFYVDDASSYEEAAERADRRIKESHTGPFIVQTLQLLTAKVISLTRQIPLTVRQKALARRLRSPNLASILVEAIRAVAEGKETELRPKRLAVGLLSLPSRISQRQH